MPTTTFFRRIQSDLVVLLCIALAGGFLILKNLDHSLLWQDEAETALVGRSIQQYGIPKGFDGINYFSQQEGGELGKNGEWKLHPWFQFYLETVSLRLFGNTTFAARLPFALFGIATLLLFYLLCKEIWPEREAAILGVLLFLFCVPWLLLVRQARYYAPAIFFQLYALIAFLWYLRRRRFSALHLYIALLLLFYTHYLYFFTFIAGSIVYTAIGQPSVLKKLIILYALLLLPTMPFLAWFAGTAYSHRYNGNILGQARIAFMMKHYLLDIGKYIFSPFLLILAGALLFPLWRQKRKIGMQNPMFLVIVLILVNFSALCVLSLEHYFRYLGPVTPLFVLLEVAVFFQLKRIHSILPWATAILYIVYMNPLQQYFLELDQDHYNGPITGIVQYLKTHIQPGDTVAISFGDLPLKFYFPNHKIYGGLTGEPLDKAVHAQWLILRRNSISSIDNRVSSYLLKHVNGADYTSVQLASPDAPFENRESPAEHRYTNAGMYPPLLLFHRKE